MAARRRPLDDDIIIIDDDALDCLANTSLDRFSAQPDRLTPFAGPATLTWSAGVGGGCRVGFRINGRSVGRSGSMQVTPTVDTTYTLSAHVRRASRVLGRVTVALDTDACSTTELSEAILRGQVEQVVQAFADEDPKAYDASLTGFDITPAGIRMSIRSRVAVNNFFDPTLYVDLVVRPEVVGGAVVARYSSFAVDIDWPWYITSLSLGVTKIVEEFKEESVEGDLKRDILARIQARIDLIVGLLGDDVLVHAVSLSQDTIRVTACPSGDDVPDIALPVFDGLMTRG